jgi:2'-5' RNA ligase
MRLFIAVNFDDGVKGRLLRVQDRIRAQALQGNFSRPEHLHLTLVFLGQTPEDQVPAICSIMAGARQRSPVRPFTLDFTRTGCFRRGGKELWWIAADNAPPGPGLLAELRRRITGGLREAGAAFDARPFNAHITLGREIKRASSLVPPDEPITVPINRIRLMKSERQDGALVYTEIFALDLAQE